MVCKFAGTGDELWLMKSFVSRIFRIHGNDCASVWLVASFHSELFIQGLIFEHADTVFCAAQIQHISSRTADAADILFALLLFGKRNRKSLNKEKETHRK